MNKQNGLLVLLVCLMLICIVSCKDTSQDERIIIFGEKPTEVTPEPVTLQNELKKIESTMTNITQEISKANSANNSLSNEARECQRELEQIKRKEAIETYEQAKQNTKANNRLQCIAANQGYIGYIRQYIVESEASFENLLSVKRQLKAAITANGVLNNEKDLQGFSETLKEFNQKYGQGQAVKIMPKFTNLPPNELERLKQQSWQELNEKENGG